jgi:Kef-type K+ transport system membrane component KefB/Trk K+ transport system NAD-binding subunit
MHLFTEISILIGIAALMSFLMRLLRQPLIIGHIFTGLLVGPFMFNFLQSTDTIKTFSEIGIAILLFTVGLNLNPKIVRDFGKVSLLTGVGQVLITSVIGFFICLLLGFSLLTSFYISVALSFSSTIIILKLLTDRGDLEKLYAKIAIGSLLVQDIIAIVLLFMVPILAEGNSTISSLLVKIFGGIAMIFAIIVLSSMVLPKLNNFIAKSEELLFTFSLAWGIGMAALFYAMGFSIESGALIAGIALSTIPSRHEINARLSPLKDFFIILFFIFLGSQMNLESIGGAIGTAVILSVFVILGKVLIMMGIMGYMGYKKKTTLQTSVTVAQISEFSLVFVAMGARMGHVSNNVLSLLTLIGLITIFGSTYLIMYSEKIYRTLAPYLSVFEKAFPHEKKVRIESYPILLFGSGRVGHDFVRMLQNKGDEFLVIEHDPEVVTRLNQQGMHAMYGDASDLDLLESLNFESVDMIISTIPDLETNLLIAEVVGNKANHDDIVLIATSHSIAESFQLYEAQYDYVVMPHFLGGNFAAELVKKTKANKKKFTKVKKEHIEYLELRKQAGHDHPAYPKG